MQAAAKKDKEFEEKLSKVKEIANKHKGDRSALLKVLQQVQNIMGYVPYEAQKITAKALGLTLSEVYSTVTFYSFFNLKPKGKYQIRVCLGTACYVKGADKILDRLKEDLKIDVGDTTDDGKFSLDGCRCIGACGLAPAIVINDEVYGRLTPDMVTDVLQKYQ